MSCEGFRSQEPEARSQEKYKMQPAMVGRSGRLREIGFGLDSVVQ